MQSETKQSDSFYDFLAWAHHNRQRLFVAGGVIVLIVIFISFRAWRTTENEAAANAALFALPSLITPPKNTAPDPNAFLAVGQEYSGTGPGERAQILAAGLLFTQGKHKEAQQAFEKYLLSHSTGPLAAEATLGVAACLDASGNANDALAKYNEVGMKFPNDHVVPQAKMAAARLFIQQKKPEMALQMYETLIKPNPYDMASEEAREQKEWLLVQYPALVKTNSPAAAASMTSFHTAPTPAAAPATNPATPTPK